VPPPGHASSRPNILGNVVRYRIFVLQERSFVGDNEVNIFYVDECFTKTRGMRGHLAMMSDAFSAAAFTMSTLMPRLMKTVFIGERCLDECHIHRHKAVSGNRSGTCERKTGV